MSRSVIEQTAALNEFAELRRAIEVLRRTVAGIATGENSDGMLGRMLLEISSVTGAHNAAVILTDRASGSLRLRAMTTAGEVVDVERDERYAVWRDPIEAAISSSVTDTLQDDFIAGPVEALHDFLWHPSLPWHRAMGHRHLMMVALRYGREVVGLLGLAFRDAVDLDSGRRNLLLAFGHQISLAIALDRAAQDARDAAVMREREVLARARAAELERAITAMQRMNDALGALDGPHAFVPEALRVAAEAFDGRSAGFFEHLDETVYLRFWLQDGRVYGPDELPELDDHGFALASSLARGFTVPDDHLGTTARERQVPVIVNHRHPAVPSPLHDFAVGMGWDWELNVPLVIDGKADAAFTLFRPLHRPFTPDEVALAEVLAKQVTLAAQASRAAERTRELALMTERNRLAADIHDSLAQSFTSIAMQSEVLAGLLVSGSPEQRTLEVIERTARRGLAEARSSIRAMRPLPDRPGALEAALAELAEHCNIRGAIECRYEQEGHAGSLTPADCETILRVAQEAASNALRHSGGSTLLIRLECTADETRLCVIDDGCGLPAAALAGTGGGSAGGGYGLQGMAQRAARAGGTLHLVSPAEGGTWVTLVLHRDSSLGRLERS